MGTEKEQRNRKENNMAQRVFWGVVLAAIVVLILALDFIWLRMLLLLALMLLAQHEMLGALRTLDTRPMAWPGYLYAGGIWALFMLGRVNMVWMLMVLVVLVTLAVSVFAVENGGRESIGDGIVSLIPLLYPLLPFQFLLAAAALPEPYWRIVLLLGVGVACVTDTFALFGGLAFGKHKMAPVISPKKTWEGAASGFVFGALSGLAVYMLQWLWQGEMALWIYLLAAALASVAGQLGDLAASGIKRACGIKDFGHLIPGHGGVMDRLDSILFAVAVSYIVVALANHLI